MNDKEKKERGRQRKFLWKLSCPEIHSTLLLQSWFMYMHHCNVFKSSEKGFFNAEEFKKCLCGLKVVARL